ncbi:MAG: adenylate kinase [Elusimicrobia bacterium]|nr:adenylate kinase [Elusimicrobiota bacterium]
MNIVLLGAPGSGKGTQAARLSHRYGIPHISTGDIFRHEIAQKTELGLKVEEYVKSGRLVPDELTVSIVSGRLTKPDCGQGFILDGFPRTVAQAESLDAYFTSAKRQLDKVVYLQMTESQAVERLSSRRQCEACGQIYNLKSQPPKEADKCDTDGGTLFQREDDKPETIRKRLVVYNELTEPLISYYRGAGLLLTVNGGQGVDSVSNEVYAALDGLEPRPA